MPVRHTPIHQPIDALSETDALGVMLASQMDALSAVAPALAAIAAAAHLVADAVTRGAVVHYAAAGSSGLMALADACELPGTFRIPQDQIRVHMAGGVPVNGHMPGGTEDDLTEAATAARAVKDGDVAIVVSASGTTPYALRFAETAAARGARIVAIANVANAALFKGADSAITLATAGEVIDGSTRLGAGTAQKVALNMISTRAGILLGHVHDGMMVNLNPDNIKLRGRAAGIVARIAGVDSAAAEQALQQTGYDTKLATLVATGLEIGAARALLDRHAGHLRACLADANALTT